MSDNQGYDKQSTTVAAPAPYATDPVSPASPVAQAQIELAARRVHDTVELLAPPGMNWAPGMSSVSTLVSVTREFHQALLRFRPDGAPTMGQNLQINQAIFDLINAGLRLSGPDRATLDALTADLAAAARNKGVTLGDAHPASAVLQTSEKPATRIGATAHGAEQIIDALVNQVEGAGDVTMKEAATARAADRLIALFEMLDASRGKEDDFEKVNDRIGYLASLGRRHHIGMVEAKLDQVFEAQDRMLIRNGSKPENQRAAYYRGMTVADLDDDRTNDAPQLLSSGQMIEQIMDGYRDNAFAKSLALETMIPRLMEPPPPRDVSAFERLLTAIVGIAIDKLTSHFANGMAKLVVAAAANPRAVKDALVGAAQEAGSTAADAGRAVKAALPGPVQRGIDAGGRGAARAGRHVADTMAPVGDAIRELMSPVSSGAPVKLKAAGGAALHLADPAGHLADAAEGERKKFVGAIGTPGDQANKPIVTAFVDQLAAETLTYSSQLTENGPALRAQLERVPPDALQQVRDGQKVLIQQSLPLMQSVIAERWTTAVAVANQGEDADGTIAHSGTIAQVFEQPGVVQLDATVALTAGPLGITSPQVVRAGRPVLHGIAGGILADIRGTRKPIHRANMHRTLHLTALTPDGVERNLGTIDFGPDGEIDLRRADLTALTAIARGQGPGARGSLTEAADALAVTPGDAIRLARAVLENLPYTTADL